MVGNYSLEKTLEEAHALELSEARATEIESSTRGSMNSVKLIKRGNYNQQQNGWRGNSSYNS